MMNARDLTHLDQIQSFLDDCSAKGSVVCSASQLCAYKDTRTSDLFKRHCIDIYIQDLCSCGILDPDLIDCVICFFACISLQDRIGCLFIFMIQERFHEFIIFTVAIVCIEAERSGMDAIKTNFIQLLEELVDCINKGAVSADNKYNIRFFFILNITVIIQIMPDLVLQRQGHFIRSCYYRIPFHNLTPFKYNI